MTTHTRPLRAGLLLAAALLATPAPAGASMTSNTIGATGTLGPLGRTATVTALIECTAGQTVIVRVTLTQDRAIGTGVARGTCTGTLTEYPVRVTAQGAAAFAAGPAQACAMAINRDGGQVVDTRQWCRANPVQLRPLMPTVRLAVRDPAPADRSVPFGGRLRGRSNEFRTPRAVWTTLSSEYQVSPQSQQKDHAKFPEQLRDHRVAWAPGNGSVRGRGPRPSGFGRDGPTFDE